MSYVTEIEANPLKAKIVRYSRQEDTNDSATPQNTP
jgi:hypothetical protein